MAATFTRKHYVEIARILSGVRDAHEKQRLAEEFARMFRQDNPQFDAERFSSAVFGEVSRGRARDVGEVRRAARPAPREADAGFAIGVYDQRIIEDNARDQWGGRDRGTKASRLVDANGEITKEGWDQLNGDIHQLEDNAMKWMRGTFGHAVDQGHDQYGDLVGAFWFDPTNPDHAWLVELASPSPGRNERIDMTDATYGDLAHKVFDGVSDFGASVLGGAITFFDVKPEDMETIEQTLEQEQRRSKRGRR